MSPAGISGESLPIQAPTQNALPLKGVSMGKVAKIAFHLLKDLAFVATGALITASVITGTFPVAVLIVSSVALGVLLTAEIIKLVHPFLPEKFQHVINVVKAVVLDIFITLGLAATSPILQTRFDPKEKDIDPNQTPVLLVHGYLNNSAVWAYHRYQYKKAGFKNVFTVDLGSPFHSIEDYSKVVQDKIKEIREITGRNDVKLIGHSMGGVVSAHYALNHAEADGIEVKDLISMGAPHKGTYVGHIGIGKCTKQMCFGSDFILDLSEKLQKSTIPHFYQGSKADSMIMPFTSSVNGEDDKQALIYKDMAHSEFLLSDRAIRANIQRLGTVNPAA